eukprot:6121713-Amphidinium_carterae.1
MWPLPSPWEMWPLPSPPPIWSEALAPPTEMWPLPSPSVHSLFALLALTFVHYACSQLQPLARCC